MWFAGPPSLSPKSPVAFAQSREVCCALLTAKLFANDLEAMSTQPSTSSTPKTDQERIVIPLATDERCWFKCRQTNAGRLRGRDPTCSLFCYYSNQLPSLITDPATSLKGTTTEVRGGDGDNDLMNMTGDAEERWDELVRKYTLSALEGKYLYFATGKPALLRHLASMRQLGSLEHHWLLQKLKDEDSLPLQNLQHQSHSPTVPAHLPDKSHRGLVVLAYHKDYESVINIAHSMASGMASIHWHIEKIYGPSYSILSKVPASPLLSNSLTLLNRSFESLSKVLGRLAAKYAARLDNSSSSSSSSNDPSRRFEVVGSACDERKGWASRIGLSSKLLNDDEEALMITDMDLRVSVE
ncbi:hypothetical protein VP01_391g7 [Puccinia sorghi]|uniref:Uncharacterized protein n=1 Tax=Puccinia sorghi TaxID=27349 RepID=A0A0L6USN4_9BASI|nr:hypothetical protein VP01_391g7 [Puccinia sorghi]